MAPAREDDAGFPHTRHNPPPPPVQTPLTCCSARKAPAACPCPSRRKNTLPPPQAPLTCCSAKKGTSCMPLPLSPAAPPKKRLLHAPTPLTCCSARKAPAACPCPSHLLLRQEGACCMPLPLQPLQVARCRLHKVLPAAHGQRAGGSRHRLTQGRAGGGGGRLCG
jgi:hypothetical protein